MHRSVLAVVYPARAGGLAAEPDEDLLAHDAVRAAAGTATTVCRPV